MREQGVQPLKLLVESKTEEKNKQNKAWPAQGLKKRNMSPASIDWDETPMLAVSNYA